jgi:hypothetical protein
MIDRPRGRRCAQAEATALVESADGHMVLLDALCATTHRYLDEHPHLQLRDLLITVDMYQRLATQIANTRMQG